MMLGDMLRRLNDDSEATEIILGVGDLSASQGIRTSHIGEASHRYPGDMWHFARNRMIVA